MCAKKLCPTQFEGQIIGYIKKNVETKILDHKTLYKNCLNIFKVPYLLGKMGTFIRSLCCSSVRQSVCQEILEISR